MPDESTLRRERRKTRPSVGETGGRAPSAEVVEGDVGETAADKQDAGLDLVLVLVREHDHVRLILKSLLVEAATDEDVAAAKREFDVLSALRRAESCTNFPRQFSSTA